MEYDGVEDRYPQFASVRLNHGALSLDLAEPFAGVPGGPVGFDLSLAGLSDERFRELAAWLPTALRGLPGLLAVTEPPPAPYDSTST